MSLIVAAVLWAGVGVGVLLVVGGLAGRPLLTGGGSPLQLPQWWDRRTALRLAATGAGVAVVLVVTGSAAAGLLAAAASWVAPRLRGGRSARDAAIARTEAIAAWTEMVRDSIVAASGLEEAITATGPVAPAAIAPEVRALVRRLDPTVNLSLPEALRAFGNDVRHPSADLVVTALVLSARMEISDLSGLLSRLADAIRDDARMRIRVEVGRTRVRTAAQVIVGVVAATALLLALTNLDYLSVYNEPAGQLVLLAVGGIFALGGLLLDRMATIDLPERFTARTTGGRSWS